jgi:hypothetical protein
MNAQAQYDHYFHMFTANNGMRNVWLTHLESILIQTLCIVCFTVPAITTVATSLEYYKSISSLKNCILMPEKQFVFGRFSV